MSRFPDNKRFAFSVFDDTDFCTLEKIEPVYRLFAELGIHTTKSVWSLPTVASAPIGGVSLQDKAYLNFVLWLQNEGFEIGLHNVQNDDATREVTQRGLEEFRKLIGQYPRTHCNHGNNRENMYWGAQRLNTWMLRLGYNLATRLARRNYFKGHLKDSPYFWGDICKERISYVRNFTFDEINLDRINPTMPYHDLRKPYVNLWFSSSEGRRVESFCKMLCEKNQDRLEAEGGVCIIYTHFASGFCKNGVLHPEFARLMRRLSKANGWFVPVATLLDHLQKSRDSSYISREELTNMERLWFWSQFRKRKRLKVPFPSRITSKQPANSKVLS